MWKAAAADEPAMRLVAGGADRVWVYRFDWDEEPTILGVDLSRLLARDLTGVGAGVWRDGARSR